MFTYIPYLFISLKKKPTKFFYMKKVIFTYFYHIFLEKKLNKKNQELFL